MNLGANQLTYFLQCRKTKKAPGLIFPCVMFTYLHFAEFNLKNKLDVRRSSKTHYKKNRNINLMILLCFILDILTLRPSNSDIAFDFVNIASH